MIDAYLAEGERRARELGNRGPLRFDGNGKLRQEILDAYWRTGFYVFEGVVGGEELSELKADFARVLERAPHARGADTDARGRPALGVDLERPQFQFARPLSDPAGGTAANGGRHPVKMTEPEAATGFRLLALASEGRHDVRESDAEVVFLDVLKNREIQLAPACELFHHSRCGTTGHPMPVDRRLRIARA